MRKIFLLLTVLVFGFSGCTGPQGPPGYPGSPGKDGVNIESEVFELQHVDFALNNGDYTIYQKLIPNIIESDNILIYRMTGTIDANTPIWQLIPRTLFLPEGELDYDFDFSKEDFTIYAGGTYNLISTPQFLFNQTFRIVIIPGYFSKKEGLDFNDYHSVIKAYGIDDSHVKILNSK